MTPLHWKILESLCLPNGRHKAAILLQTDADKIDWAALLAGALRHKMLAALASALSDVGVGDHTPVFLYKHSQQFLFLTNERAKIYEKLASELSDALSARGIPHAFAKGLVAQRDIFEPTSSREMGDIDIAVYSKDRMAVVQMMEHLGFSMSLPYLDGGELTLRPYDRKLELIYQMAPDHLPHFSRSYPNAAAPAVVVDYSHSMLWHDNPYGHSLEHCFAHGVRTIPMGQSSITAFSIEIQFLWTILHLFRDAWLMTTRHFEKDVTLSKFRDVIHYWYMHNSALCTNAFRQILRESSLEGPVSWVLLHADRAFGTEMNSELGLTEGPPSPLFLNSACIDAGQTVVRWRGAMTQRLRSDTRESLFDFTHTTPWRTHDWNA